MDVINSLLRAARAGNLKRVLELVEDDLVDINSCNANGLTVLHSACKEGHTRIVEELVARGANVHAKTLKGNQPIHIASLAGHEPVVRVLLDQGADVNAQSVSGFTSLYMAAQENHESIVRLLLERGADQNISTTDGFTPLAVSLQQNHENIAKILLSHEARGQVRFPGVTDTGRSLLHVAAKKNDCAAAALLLQNNISPDVTSKSNFTSLHVACHYGNEAVAKLLLDNQADVNFQAKQNITPIHVAARWNQARMINLLLDNGAKIDAKTKDHLTPLHCAARMGHNECLDLLIQRGAPISAKTRSHLVPLHMSAQGNHLKTAQILLANKAPVDDVTIDHLTSLHVASHCGHVKVAKLLLDHKAEPNLRAQNGFTSLHIACKKNHLEVVKLLLKYGASLLAVTESGLSCLHIASFMGCVDIVVYLLEHGADIEAQTIRGETPLILATRANQLEVINVLLQYGANVNAQDQNHQNGLHLAARLGNAKIARSLLERGVNIDAPTRQMYTALHIAAKENHEEVVALLLDNGANIACATRNHEFFPLHLASKYGNERIVELLLDYGAPVDARGKNDVTSLMVASHYDHPRVVELLQMFGASPHATAKNGYTAIHIAAKGNRLDCANILLSKGGANPNVESKAGFCPLHLASQEGRADMAALLLNSGAQVNCRARNGITPLHLCAQEDHVSVAQLLVKYGAHLDSQTRNGFTPLHVACHFARLRMIRFLLANGADVNVPAASGYTSLHQASQQGNSQIVDLLLQYNARPEALTETGYSALAIAENLNHVSVIETLRIVTEKVIKTTKTTITEEKFKIVAPETMQETFVSDSEDEADDTPAHQESVKFLTTDVMRSFNSTNMADDNYNTSQSNLAEQQARRQQQQQLEGQTEATAGGSPQRRRVDSLQQLNEELQGGGGRTQSPAGVRTTRIADEMSQDLQYLSREAPLDGGESTFGGVYSTLGAAGTPAAQQQQQHQTTTTTSHTYTTTIRRSSPGADGSELQAADYADNSDFRLDADEAPLFESVNQSGVQFQVLRNGGGGAGNNLNFESTSGGRMMSEQEMRANSLAVRQQSSEALEQLAPDNVDIQRPLQQAGSNGARKSHDGAAENQGGLQGAQQAPIVVLVRGPTRPLKPFLVSFMVDARGGAMRGCRHSGVRVIIPPGAAPQPMRITCRYLRRERLIHPPPLMEGEACASKIMEVGPAGAKFLAPVLLEVPHFASLRNSEREIIILRSDSGEVWREHLVEADEQLIEEIISSAEHVENQLNYSQDNQENLTRPSSAAGDAGAGGGGDATNFTNSQTTKQQQERRLTRIVTTEFPQYFAIISRVRQEVHTVGPEGSLVDSQAVPKVQAIFTEGALTKRIKIGLQKKISPNQSPQLQAKEVQQHQQQQQDAGSGERTPRAQSPASLGAEERARSPTSGGSRPSSAAAKRRSRFLACFGAGRRDSQTIGETDSASSAEGGDKTEGEGAADSEPSDSSSANSLGGAGSSSPSMKARKKRNAGLQDQQQQLVPEDYYIERDTPLLLNLAPSTYGKRMASSWAQTDQLSANQPLSTSARGKAKRRAGRNKAQMTLPLHEPTAGQAARKRARGAASAEITSDSERPADSSLESQAEAQQPTFSSATGSGLAELAELAELADLKCLTRTIQTDSDSVTVQYVTIYGQSGAAEAVEASSQTVGGGGGKTGPTGQDDGYVSGSGDLKKERPASSASRRAGGLFSPFCASSKSAGQSDDDSSLDNIEASGHLSLNEAGQLDLSKSAKNKNKDKKKQKQKAAKAAAAAKATAKVKGEGEPVASGASSPTLTAGGATSPDLTTQASELDDSLRFSLSQSRSISPPPPQADNLSNKARKKLEKEAKLKQRELDEAAAKAEKARKKLEKDQRKSGASFDSDEGERKSPSFKLGMPSLSIGGGGAGAKAGQSVKFAPSPVRSGATDPAQLDASVELSATSACDEAQVQLDGETGRRSLSPSRLTKQVIDSMSSKFKVKAPKARGGGKLEADLGGEADVSLAHATGDQDESLVHVSIGADGGQPASLTRDVSFEDERLAGNVELPSGSASISKGGSFKVGLRPILKQSSSQEQESPETLRAIASRVVGEATEAAVKRVGEFERPEVTLETPSLSIKLPKGKLTKGQKAELKLRQAEEKRLAKELDDLVKQAEGAAKRAEHEVKSVTLHLQAEAEKQARIAKLEADRAVHEIELKAKTIAPTGNLNLNLKTPQLKMSGGSGGVELTMPDIKKLSKEEAKRLEAEAKLKAKEAKAEAKRLAKEAKEKLKLEGKGKLKGFDVSLPSADISLGGAAGSPSIEATKPTVSGSFEISDDDTDNSKKTPSKSKSKGGFGIKMPDLSLPDFSLKKGDVQLPEASGEVQVGLTKPKLEGSLELKGTSDDDEEDDSQAKDPKKKSKKGFGIKMPDMSLPEFSLKKKKLDGSLDVELPEGQIDASIEVPQVEGSLEADLGSPDSKSKSKSKGFGIKMPDLSMPDFHLKKGKGKLDMPEVPEGQLDASLDATQPKIEGSIDVQGPSAELDVDASGPELKSKSKSKGFGIKLPDMSLPDFHLKKKKLDGSLDVDLPEGQVDVTLPKVEGSIEADVSSPKLDLESPDAKLKTKSKGFGIKLPDMSLPDFHLKKKKIDGVEVELPEGHLDASIDATLPKVSGSVEVEAPDVDLNLSPDSKAKSKSKGFGIKLPDLSMPDFHLKKKKLDGVEVELPEGQVSVDVTVPKVEGSIEASVSQPDLDLDSPDSKSKKLKSKSKGFGLKMPDFSLKKKKLDGSIDVDLPEVEGQVDVNLPKVEGSIEADVSSPKLDLDSPDAKLKTKSKGFGIKLPDMSLPDFHLKKKKIDGVEVELPEGQIEASVSLPKVEAGISQPEADLNLSPDSKSKSKSKGFGIKLPDMSLPDFHLKKKKLDGSLDVDLPEGQVVVTLPRVEGSIEADVSQPKLDLESPDAKLKTKSKGFGIKLPDMSLPDFHLKKKKIDGVEVELPEGQVDASTDVTVPKVEAGVSQPDVDLDLSPDDSSKSKSKSRGFGIKLPDFHLKKKKLNVELPEGQVDASIDATLPKGSGSVEIDAPEVDLDLSPDSKAKLKSKSKGFGIKMPEFHLKKKKLDGSLDVELPEGEVDVSPPEVSGSIEADVSSPDSKSKSKSKGFGIKLPDMSLPDFHLKKKKIDGVEVELPEGQIEASVSSRKVEAGISQPEVDLDLSPDSKSKSKSKGFGIKLPDMSLPDFHLKKKKLDGVEVDLPEGQVDVTLPKVEGSIEADVSSPKLDLESLDAKVKAKSKGFGIKLPDMSLPDFHLKKKKIDGVEVELPEGQVDVSIEATLPKVSGSVEVEAPEKPTLDAPELSSPDTKSKSKGFGFKLPDFHLKRKKIDGVEVELPEGQVDVEVTLPKVGGALEADISRPKIDADVELDSESTPDSKSKSKSSGFSMKLPGFHLKGKGKKGDLDIAATKGELPSGSAQIDVERPQIEGEFDAKVKSPKSKGGFSVKMPDVSLPEISLKTKGVKGELEIDEAAAPTGELEGTQPKSGFNVKLPEVSLPSLKMKGGKKGELPELGEQQVGVSSELPEVEAKLKVSKKDKKKKKDQKKKKGKATISDSSSSLEDSAAVDSKASEPTTSKSSFFGRLFRSKGKLPSGGKLEIEVPQATGVEVDLDASSKSLERQKRDLPQSAANIVSEMYPSDPNNVDGEMILEVNVPESIEINASKMRAQIGAGQLPAATTTTLSSTTMTTGEPLDDQEATLVNISQMNDEIMSRDDDEATENVLSQATNVDLEGVTLPSASVSMKTPSGGLRARESSHDADVQLAVKAPRVELGASASGDLPALEAGQQHQKQLDKLELKGAKGRKELEVKLEKEAKRQAAEEEKVRKKQAKEAEKQAKIDAKREAKETKARLKREAVEAKRLAELAVKEAKEAKKLAKKNKKKGVQLGASIGLPEVAIGGTSVSAAAAQAGGSSSAQGGQVSGDGHRQQQVTTSTAILSSSSISGAQPEVSLNLQDGGEQAGRQMHVMLGDEVPINEETEVERIVEEVVGPDGTVTKTTRTIETKYVTLRQEELRVAERRDLPAVEWERLKAEASSSGAGESSMVLLAEPPQSTSGELAQAGDEVELKRLVVVERFDPAQSMAAVSSAELEEIRATPSYFSQTMVPPEIKPDLAAKKVKKERVKLNQKLIKRALKLARSEAKKAKVSKGRAEAEIAVCDEAARRARKQLRVAVHEAKRAAKEAAKQHKKMDKVDKKLAKFAKKLEKRQKKIDKKMAKLAKKAEAKRAKEAKKAAKKRKSSGQAAAAAGEGDRASPSRSSKRSIKLEDISEPILRSSSRLSIGGVGGLRQSTIEGASTSGGATIITQHEHRSGSSPSDQDIQVDLTLDENVQQFQQQHPQLTQDQIEQLVRDGKQAIVHTITRTVVTQRAGDPEGEATVVTSERVLTGSEAEAAALRMELEAAAQEAAGQLQEEEEEEIDVVGLPEVEAGAVAVAAAAAQEQDQENQTPLSTPDVSQASSGGGGGSKKKNRKRNKKQKSRESAE